MDGNDTQRESKEEKERKNGWEKGEKEKQPLQKPKHTKQETTLFSLFLLFSLTSPLFFFSLSFFHFKINKTLESTQMTDKKDLKTQSVDELEVLVTQGDMDAKRELAIRLIEGNGVPQNHPKAVALLEDCVALGDTDAMLILSKCCAFGYGIEHNAELAESLISEAANKGNEEAQSLMKLINNWKGKYSIYLDGLLVLYGKRILETHSDADHRTNQRRIND